MAVGVSASTYNTLAAQRDSLAASVAAEELRREQAEAQRAAFQQQLDDFDVILAELTIDVDD